MIHINHIGTQDKAPDEIIRSDGVVYTFNHSTSQDEYGSIIHTCEGYLITPEELNDIHNGNLPDGFVWNDFLHRMYRTYQHQRADNEYVYAQRMFRTTQDSKYSDYITALDQWNAQVSATASIYSTDIPDMPTLE